MPSVSSVVKSPFTIEFDLLNASVVKLALRGRMKLSHRKQVCYSITIAFLFISLSLFSCGGCGGSGSSTSNNSPGNSATLTWDPPTTNADGTPLTDLAGYKIYYGTSPDNYTVVINVGNVTIYRIDNMPLGTYYFAVTAYDTAMNESDYSNEVSKIIK